MMNDGVASDIVEGQKYIPYLQEDSLIGIVLRMGLIIALTLLVAQLARWAWGRMGKKQEQKIHHKFLYNMISILIYVVGFLIAITQINGASDILGKVLAGSSFLALAVGLAAQESLGNLINGIVLTVSKPFEVGDRIRLVNANITGYIEDITLRHTVMRTFVNSRLIIPNSTLNKELIENSNYQIAQASNFVDATITFDSNMDRAMEIMEEIISNHPMFYDRRTPLEMKELPKVKVYVRELTINGIQLRASMWTEDVNDNFEACSDARYEVKKAFDEEGILMAQVPSRPSEFARAGAIPAESGNYPKENGAKPSHRRDESEDIDN